MRFLVNGFLIIIGFLLPVQSLLGITPEAAEAFRITSDLFKDHEYERAKELFNSLLGEMEEYRGEALYRIGECDYNLRNYDRAIENFRKVWEEYGDTYLAPEALYGLILSYIASGNFREAEEILSKLISRYPGYKKAKKTLLAEAILSFEKGNYPEVVKKLENIDTKEALFYKAKSYFSMSKAIEALSHFKKLTEDYPDSPLAQHAYYYMGDVLFFSGDYEGALYKYNIFLDKYPYSKLKDYAKYKLAVCYFNKGDYSKAMRHLKPILNSSDNFLAAHSSLLFAESLLGVGEFDEALRIFTRVISNYANLKVSAMADLRMGETFLEKDDTVQARIVYQQMASRYTSGEFGGFGDYLAGAQLFEEEDFSQSKNYFTRILKNYSGSDFICPATAMLIRTYNKMGDYELSIALGSRLLKDIDCSKKRIWKGRAMFHLAEAYYIKSRYKKAKELYREVTEQFNIPELMSPALTALGWCLLHEGRYDIAEKQFKKVLTGYSRDTTSFICSLLGEGVVLYNRGEYKDALDYFERVPDISPEKSLAAKSIFYAGKCYYNLEYYRQGIEGWERVLSEYHDTEMAANAAYQIGQTYFQALKYDQSIAYFRLLIKDYPESPLVLKSQIALGHSYYNSQDYQSAVREFSKFLSLYPEDTIYSQVRSSLSLAYYMLGQEDKDALKEFIKRFPGDPKAALAQFNLGVDAYDKGDHEVAIEEFRKTVVDFPETEYSEKAQINILKCYEDMENHEKMAKEAEQFLEYFPKSKKVPLALFYKGMGYFYLNDYEKAIKAFKSIAREYPESEYVSCARYNLSQCYKKMGETERAVGELKTYSNSGEGSEFKGQILSGAVYQEQGDYERALNIYSEIKPTNLKEKAELYSRKGECCVKLDKIEVAIVEYKRLLPLNLKNNKYQMKGLAELGGLYEGKKDIQKAIKTYSRLLEITTDESVISTVRERLEYLKSRGR